MPKSSRHWPFVVTGQLESLADFSWPSVQILYNSRTNGTNDPSNLLNLLGRNDYCFNNHNYNNEIIYMRKFGLVVSLFAVLPVLSLSSSVQAALIEVNYTGTTTSVGASLTGTFSVGDSVQGTVVYDTTTPQDFASPTIAAYSAAIQSYDFLIGSYAGSATGTIRTYNDDPTFGDGAYFLGNTDVSAAQVGGQDLSRVQLFLNTNVLTTLTNLDLPSVGDLNQLWANNIAAGNINFIEFSGSGDDVRYSLNNVTAKVITDDEVVPAPATIALISLGLAGIGYKRRKQIKAA